MSQTNQTTSKIADFANSQKKESVSIPSGSIVKAALISIDYTKGGEAAGSIVKGIGVKFAFLSYYTGKGADAKMITCIDYSDLKNIKFPVDRVNPDGSIDRPGLYSKPIYMSENVVRSKNFNVVETEEGCAMMYAYLLGKQFGDEIGPAFLSVLGNSGLCKITPLYFAMNEFSQNFPIIHAFRYTDMKYNKKDLLPDGTPGPTAKKEFSENLTCWDYINKNMELAKTPIEYLTPEQMLAISDALSKRQDEKRAESLAKTGAVNASIPSPF